MIQQNHLGLPPAADLLYKYNKQHQQNGENEPTQTNTSKMIYRHQHAKFKHRNWKNNSHGFYFIL